MNSKLKVENVKNLVDKISDEKAEKILNFVQKYNEATKQGNMKDVYNEFLSFLKGLEEETGVVILESPDDTYINALNELTGRLTKKAPALKNIYFESVDDADEWLEKQENIIVTSFDVNMSEPSIFRRAFTKEVVINYELHSRKTGVKFGLFEDASSKLFFKINLEKEIKIFEKLNPGCKVIDQRCLKSSRSYDGLKKNRALFVFLYRYK